MPKHRPDLFSGDLFAEPGEQVQKPPELLNRNETGQVVDSKGNVYDDQGNLLREKPSDILERALAIARREYPDAGPDDPLVQHYVRELRAKGKIKDNRIQ